MKVNVRDTLLVLAAVIVLGVIAAFAGARMGDDSTVFGPPAVPRHDVGTNVQVVTVQMRWDIKDYATPESFVQAVRHLVAEGLEGVDRTRPVLFVFPEDVGAPLVFLNEYQTVKDKTTLKGAVTSVILRNAPGVLWQCLRYRVGPVRGLALSKAPTMGRVYVETFSRLARENGVYIIAGSAPLPDFPLDPEAGVIRYRAPSKDVYNVAYFFGPDGRILARQKKVHLIPLEQPGGLDLTPGKTEDLVTVKTGFGTVGIAVCLDAFHEDVLRRLIAQGADLLVQPSANPGPWNEWQQRDWLNGSWKAVQEHPQLRYAVNPMMTGDLFDLAFEGQSSVVTKAENARTGLSYPLAPVDGGFLSLAGSHKDQELLFTVLQ